MVHKKNIIYSAAGIFGILFIAFFLFHFHKNVPLVTLKFADTFIVPNDCKTLALIGSTPHPTELLKNKPELAHTITKLKLEELLDLADLQDSFTKTFKACKKANIDHLLIAYLPVYYAKLKVEHGDKTTALVYDFLQTIAPQIQSLVNKWALEQRVPFKITMILPTYNQLIHIPDKVSSPKHYAQFLIKQFPRLEFDQSQLQTIVIINTKINDTNQNAEIIRYLTYEYLLERPLEYRDIALDKEKFHKYL